MEGRARSLSAYAAAATLAAITLAVFFELQDYGPESAIRRFHRDVAGDDPADLQRVTGEPISGKNPQKLVSWVKYASRAGAHYQLVRMDRSPDQVRAALLYRFPDGRNLAMIWVVERTDRIWRVNADKTMTIIEDLGRPG